MCFRCGYDLSAVAQSWADECPLRGTCSECGHGFFWGEVFSPETQDIPGFIEHVDSRPLEVFRAAWRTLWWTLTFRLWSRVGVEHRVVLYRSVLCLVITLGCLHAVASALAMIRVLWLMRGYYGPGAMPGGLSNEGLLWQLASAWMYPVASIWWGMGASGFEWQLRSWPDAVVAAGAAHTAATASLLLLPSTRQLARVRAAHVLRAAIYGWSWVLVLAAFRMLRNAWTALEIIATGATAQMGRVGGAPRVTLGGPMPIFLDAIPQWLLAAVLLSWVGVWWYRALSRGWQVPRPWFVWTVLAVHGGLFAAVVIAHRSIW